ncbi:MAG: helix-turn-helix domain-containing protein [Hyphomicrobiaceae bacterium]|nr:helix-turn-helix domain-containing protein [Hyphomicrobiaceae bacterium]
MDSGKIIMSIDDIIEETGLGRTTVFGLFKSGALRAVKIGKRTFVRRDDFREFVNSAPERPRDAA